MPAPPLPLPLTPSLPHSLTPSPPHPLTSSVAPCDTIPCAVTMPTMMESLPDLLAPGIELLFVGINPSLYSARAGHYYARPGNMFWRCLHERSEEHTSELQSRQYLVCRLL